MPIVRIPDPNALPTIQNDYVRQNNKIATGFLQVNKPIWEDAANNIVQGAVFQVGGTVYHCTAATAIGGGASSYIKLTPSGDGSTLAPTYVADLTGVTWNSAYNGYYDVSGNLYVFDELVALQDGEIAAVNIRLWKAINTLLNGNFTFSGNPIFSGNPNFQDSFQTGRKITGFLYDNNPTENEIFDALVGSLPNTNDAIIISGGALEDASSINTLRYGWTFSYAKKTSSTIIILYANRFGVEYNGSNIIGANGAQVQSANTNGSGTVLFDHISIAW